MVVLDYLRVGEEGVDRCDLVAAGEFDEIELAVVVIKTAQR